MDNKFKSINQLSLPSKPLPEALFNETSSNYVMVGLYLIINGHVCLG